MRLLHSVRVAHIESGLCKDCPYKSLLQWCFSQLIQSIHEGILAYLLYSLNNEADVADQWFVWPLARCCVSVKGVSFVSYSTVRWLSWKKVQIAKSAGLRLCKNICLVVCYTNQLMRPWSSPLNSQGQVTQRTPRHFRVTSLCWLLLLATGTHCSCQQIQGKQTKPPPCNHLLMASAWVISVSHRQ